MIIVASATTVVVAHELTHFVLASNPQGICFGYCGETSHEGISDMTFLKPFMVGATYAEHNKLSRREDIPTAIGLVSGAMVVLVGIKFLGEAKWQKE